jgi:hypothetical protein
MRQSKKSYDWSKPPQGGIDGRGKPSYRSEPKLFWGVTNFLILTVGVGFSSSLIAPLTYILLFAALFFFVVGIVMIPIVAVMQAGRYWKMIAFILRGVNLYVLTAYAMLAGIFALSRYEDSLKGLLIFAPWLGGIGYFIAITTSAAIAMERNPKSVVAKNSPNLENLGQIMPSEDERV